MSAPGTVLAISFTPRPAKESPNLRNRLSVTDAAAAQIYYKSSVVTFGSVRRWNHDLPLIFITDVAIPEPYCSILRSLDVRIEVVPFLHRPPLGFSESHVGSLYSLDALNYLASEDHQQTVLLDPDVLCRGNLSPLFKTTRGWVGALPRDYINRRAAAVHAAIDPALKNEPAKFYQGTCYVVDASYFTVLLERIDLAWERSLSEFSSGRDHLVTDQDFLNFALRSVPVVSIRPYISTIWTTRTRRSVPADVQDLLMWDLPSEKDRAFAKLFDVVRDSASWFWVETTPNHRDLVNRVTQVPRRTMSRWTADNIAKLVRAFQAVLSVGKAVQSTSVSESTASWR